MAYFEDSRDVIFSDCTLNGVFNIGLSGLQILSQSITPGATHDAAQQDPPSKCHPDTRKKVIKTILEWTHGPLETDESRIFWMNGPAGVGKTAIAWTVCERLLESGQLGGSFFFSRMAAGRNTYESLFPAIAYQLASADRPTIRKAIEEKIKDDPAIPKKNMKLQLEKLIIEPLRLLDPATSPLIIVIDGLDECQGETTQKAIVQLLGSLSRYPSLPVKFILMSRPEPWIQHEFDTLLLLPHTRRTFLEQTSETDEDIRTFLRSGFTDICSAPDHQRTMVNVPKPWPSPSVVGEFVEGASGQFIYASTVLKFVGDPSNQPTVQLDLILSAARASNIGNSTNPLAALDRLYVQILSTSVDKQQTLDVLGAVIALTEINVVNAYVHYLTKPCRVAEELLGLQPEKALRTIRSLVDVSKDGVVKFFHKSLPDFLLDASRSGDYFIDINAMHSRITLACLKAIRLNPDIVVCDWSIWLVKGQAAYFWDTHSQLSSVSDQDRLCDEIKRINPSLFYYHLVREWVAERALKVRHRLHMRQTEPSETLQTGFRYLPRRKGNWIESIEECHRHNRPSEASIYFRAAFHVFWDLRKRYGSGNN
ncbi:hypothetical protein BDZ97DRAFT_251425 [Flammula alnicola]|nr:hypothetical protein BDZ97DRAFT_251425 [Flammula alnicola]